MSAGTQVVSLVKVQTLCASPDEPHARWADASRPCDIIQQLAERCAREGATCAFASVAAQADQPDAYPFDPLGRLAFDVPLLTRRQRADHVMKQQVAFFNYLDPEAREILNDLLEQYASDGELQFTLPDVLKLLPISHHGNVNEIIGKFGGPDQLCSVASQLQSLVYE